MDLTIAMNGPEINEAITQFITKSGLVVPGTPMDVSITGPRGAADASAVITVKSATEEATKTLPSELQGLPPAVKGEGKKPSTVKKAAPAKTAVAKAAATVPPEPKEELPAATTETLFADGAPEGDGELEQPLDVSEEVEEVEAPPQPANAEKVESLFG